MYMIFNLQIKASKSDPKKITELCESCTNNESTTAYKEFG